MNFRKLSAIVVVAILGWLGHACGGADESEGESRTIAKGAALQPAQNCEQIRDKVVDTTTEQILQQRYQYYASAAEGGGTTGDSSGRSAGESTSESPEDYTETNTQEEGVDETDIVKTDGDYIYTVDQNELVILKSWPAEETSIVGRYSVAGGDEDADNRSVHAQSLFHKKDRVAVFSGISEFSRDGSRGDNFRGTRVTILDVSDRSEPTLLKQLDLEGWMVSGRMIDGDVYLVSRSGVQVPFDTWEIASSEDGDLPPRKGIDNEALRKERVRRARPIVRDKVRERLSDESVAEMFPERRLFDGAGALESAEPMYECEDLYLPQQDAQIGVLNVSHFDFDAPEKVTSTGLLADGWTVYASKQNLYVAMSSRFWLWGWGWNQADDTSHIHKFAFDGDDNRPRYAASGKVDGWLLDQFAMDEHDGHLRVASTESGTGGLGRGGEASENHLTVLEQSGKTLQEVGSVRGLAEGERIYAVRMMGDEGYIVTFRQIDPLFAIDLSDPTDPQVKGELKITGFSNYIHPLGEEHLMTIGQDADEEGRIQGVQLQIFDVGDMTDPTRVHQERITTEQWSSWSEAMWNHHAFTYHPEREVLAFPVNIYDWDRHGGNFSGLLLYEANAEDGFSSIGRVSHGDLGDNESRWWTTVRRSIFIEDYVYSLSQRGLKVNDLREPKTERAAVAF